MAKIKKIYEDAELTKQILPETNERAVFDDNGNPLNSKLGQIIDLLHQKQMAVGAVPSDLTPTEDSDHWVTSDGIVKYVNEIISTEAATAQNVADSDGLVFSDEEGNAIGAFMDGHVKTKNYDSHYTPIEQVSNNSSQLSIADEQGNVIAEFKDGNFATKNFDSRNITGSSIGGGYKKMVIGSFKNGSLNTNNIITQTTRSLVSDTLAIPYEGASLFLSLKNGYTLTVRCGFINGDDGTTYPLVLGTYSNGDKIDLPLTTSNVEIGFIRLQVQRTDGNDITPSEQFGLSLYYQYNYDICDSNADLLDTLQSKALVREPNEYTKQGKAVFVHGSDIHADWIRLKGLFDVANIINADAILLTGDFVAHNHYDGLTPMIELAKASNIPVCISCGNHEVGYKYGSVDFEVSDSDVFDYVFEELVDKFNYLASSGTNTTVPYYYYDIASKKIRIISAYQYVSGTQEAQSGISNLRWTQHYNQEEADWLVSTLLSTPNDYGVVILYHTPELSMDAGKIAGNDLFFPVDWTFGSNANSITNGYFLREIIDAFIARTTLSKTYTQIGSPSSLSVDADFSSVSSSIEFIGIVNGHYHQDAIGLASGASQRQVQMSIASTSATHYQSKKFDCPRNSKSNSADAFNVYVIDRDTHAINVYRIGTHRTIDGRNRTSMEIQYKNN